MTRRARTRSDEFLGVAVAGLAPWQVGPAGYLDRLSHHWETWQKTAEGSTLRGSPVG